MNFTFKRKNVQTYLDYYGKRYVSGYNEGYKSVNKNRYDIVLRPNDLNFQIINITAKDNGYYRFCPRRCVVRTYPLELKITSMFIVSCMVII